MKFPIIILLAAGALSAPFSIVDELNRWEGAFVGKDGCTDPRLKDDYTSIFDYEGETLSTVQGATADSTGLKLRARIYINPLGACKYSMQINHPELLVKSKNQQQFQTADESRKFSRELEAQDLVFKTSGGRITQLFPDLSEATHVLNIKRGILSTLQLEENAKEEVDVNGRCKVNVYEQDGTFYKSKNLSDCTDRAHNELGFQTATFANSKMPVEPLNSTSTCVFKMNGKNIVSTVCTETHIFRPFSAGYDKPAGAITTVKQTLKFAGEKYRGKSGSAIESKARQGASLVYQHESEVLKPDNSIIDRIDKVMSSLVDTSKENNYAAKQGSAHEFVHLVNLVRKLDSKRMTPALDKYIDCYRSGVCASADSDIKTVYRQYFLDALTYCGTATCVSAVHKVIISGEVSGEYMNMFLQGISLVAKPTQQMVMDVMNIAKEKPSRQAFLSLGILINRLCSDNTAACAYSKTSPITLAELFLEGKLGKACDGQESHERVEEILMAIKAIGNAGQPTRVLQTLLQCVKTSQHMNITTAALDALRRMPCSNDIQSILHKIHEDISVDTEKRIQTYLALMRCPTEKTLTKIVRQLESEKSNQVGSFMWSHLMNINESSDPRHATTQTLLASILKGKDLKKFDLSFTKFSKAFESSVYSKYLKSGVSVDGHLIYNPDSFLPKSALFNLTANILDVPVNMIEMAARVEGVETLVEDLFGPYGYFPDDGIMKIFNVTFTKDDIEKLRSRRSADDDNVEESISEMHKKVNKKRTQPGGFLSMKVLGHEMKVFSYDDILWAADEVDNMNVIELLLKVAKGGHKTFTKSIMFLEMTHTVPTGLGLPMKLKLTGSAVGSIELDGKFDIRNMFWGPSSLEVKGYVRPSAVVEIAGQMGVHSHFVDTGVFVNTSMFTSQMLKGSVVYKEGQQFKINIDAPEQPIEFFNISATPYMFVDEQITLIEGAPRKIKPEFCMNSTMVLGLGLCTSMSVPLAFRDYEAPYFPLSGPAHFGLKLVKADPKLTTYQFLVSVAKRPVGSGQELEGSFEIGTPGATYSRRLSGVIKYKETRNIRQLTIGSLEAHNNAEFSVSYHNETNRIEMDLSTNIITKKPMKLRMLFFNDTSFIAKEMGILASAEYDWYKFQHVSKFVRKIEAGSYLLHTRTTYWPKKHLTAEVEYTPKAKSLTVRLDANQLNQRFVLDGSFISTDTESGLNFRATNFGTMSNVSFYTGFKNSATEKKVIFNTTCSWGKRHEIVWGYYRGQLKDEVRFDVSIAGRTAALFADFSKMSYNYMGINVGASVQKNMVGISGSYNMESKFNQQACLFAFYNEKKPAKTCVALREVPASITTAAFKQLVLSVDVLKKTAAVTFDMRTAEKSYGFTSTLVYQTKEIAKNVVDISYNSIWETEMKITSTAAGKSVSTRFYSTKSSQDLVLFGVEAIGFNQLLKLQGTYSKSLKGDAVIRGVIFEGWVNKKLPVSYTLLVEASKVVKGISSIFRIKEYSAKSSLIWVRPQDSEYSIVSEASLTKKDFTIFAIKTTDILVLSDVEKAYKFIWDVTVWDKSFKYGYDVSYENQSTASKSAYAIRFGVNYARNKRSSIITTFVNSDKVTEMLVDVAYLPGKQVSHVVRYTKASRQVDVSIEFLPKMFVKFMGRLDKTDGWKFTSDLAFSWTNYQKSMQWIASYVNKAGNKGLNFKFTAFNQIFLVESAYNSKDKTFALSVTAFKRTARLSGFWVPTMGRIGVKISTYHYQENMLTPKEIAEALIKYSKTDVSFELKTTKKSILKTTAVFDKSNGVGSLEMLVMNRDIFKLQTQYSYEKQIVRLFVLGKERFNIVGKYNKAEKTFLLSFDALRKNWNVLFSAKWIAERKELSVGTVFMKRSLGFLVRLDPSKYVASTHVYYQKKLAGWTMLYDPENSAVVYNVTLTPRLSAQAILRIINDNIVSASLQRKIGSEVVTEAVFKYALKEAASSFIFEWNKDTVSSIRDLVMPVLKSGYKNVTSTLLKIAELSRTLSAEAVKNTTAKILMLIDNADRMFDNFDFVAARDNAGKMAVKILKKSSSLSSDALKMTSKMLMKIHDNMPLIMEKTKLYSKKGMALTKSVLDASYDVATVTYKVAKNLTESSLPVARAALKLAKEFKIRGRTAEEIATEVVQMVKKVFNSYKKNLSKQIETLKTDVKQYVVSLKVPYSEKKLGEIVDEFVAKIKAFNLEKKVRELTKKVMEYEIKGAAIKVHLKNLKEQINNLPVEMKKMLLSSITYSKTYAKKYQRIVESFFQPMTKCLKKIKASVIKHFAPLVVKAKKGLQSAFKEEFNKVYMPIRSKITKIVAIIKKFILPVVRPLQPLYNSIKDQIRAIEVLEYEIGTLFDSYVETYKQKIMLKYGQVKDLVKAVVYTSKLYAGITSSWTLEQTVEYGIDFSVAVSKSTVQFVKKVYQDRQMLYDEVEIKANTTWKKVSNVISVATSRPVEDMIHEVLVFGGKYTMLSVKEIAQLLDQIAAIDFATPLAKAWTEIDILNHLDSYGINGKILHAITTAKNVNVTEFIFKVIRKVKQMVELEKERTEAIARDVYGYGKNAYVYVRSIPKKTYEELFSEIETAVRKGQLYLYKMYQPKMLKDLYLSALKKTEMTKDMITKTYQQYVTLYGTPLKDWSELVKERYNLVYGDVKDDCLVVKNFYQAMITGMVKEKYDELKNKLTAKYDQLYSDAMQAYRKYEDKTWEEIGMNTYSFGEKKVKNIRSLVAIRVDRLRNLTKTSIDLAKKNFEKVKLLVKKQVALLEALFNDKIKPEAIRLYKKTVSYTKTKFDIYYAKAYDYYVAVPVAVIRVYEANKDLSIRQLYAKITEATRKAVEKYMNELKAVAMDKYGKVYGKSLELKEKFVKEMLPIILQESESIINQTLRASVIIVNETVKAFTPHFEMVKVYSTKYIKDGKIMANKYYGEVVKAGKEYMKDYKLKSVEQYQKLASYLNMKYNKLAVYVESYLEKVKNHPKYLEIINHELYIKVKNYIKTVSEMLKAKLVIVKARIEMLKALPKVYWTALKDKNERLQMILKTLKQIKESGKFTLKKLKEKIMPQIAKIQKKITQVPDLMMVKMNFFRENPEESFWMTFRTVKSALTNVKDYDWRSLKTTMPKLTRNYYSEMTDSTTKDFVISVKKTSDDFYNRLAVLPQTIKVEAMKIYKKQVEMIKVRWEQLVAQWKESAVYPIVSHEIWAEIAGEVKNHEIVVELQSLVKQSMEIIKAYNAELMTKTKKFIQEKKALVKAKIDALIVKYNKFIDETTLESIVLKTKELYSTTQAKLIPYKEKLIKKVKQIYTKAVAEFLAYKMKVVDFGKTRYAKAVKVWNEKYPKVVSELKSYYKKYVTIVNAYAKKAMKYSNEMKDAAIAKSLKVWNESKLKERFVTLKGMTVGETVAAAMEMPRNAKLMYKKLEDNVKLRYEVYVQPHVKTIVNAAKMVGNEINQTVVFIFRFYRLKENVQNFYNNGYKQIQSMVPKIAVLSTNFAKALSKSSVKGIHNTLVYLDTLDLKPYIAKMKSFVPNVKKYINIEANNGQVAIHVFHPAIKPSFKHQITFIKTKIQTVARKVRNETVSFTNALLKDLKARTLELRKDLNKTIAINMKLGRHLQSRAAVLKEIAMNQSVIIMEDIFAILKDSAKRLVKDGNTTTSAVYKFGSTAVVAIINSETFPAAYEKTQNYYKIAAKNVKKFIRPYSLIVRVAFRIANSQYDMCLRKVKPYYSMLKSASMEWRKGAGFRTAFKQVEKDLKAAYTFANKKAMQFIRSTKNMFKHSLASEDIEIIDQYLSTQKSILGKYVKQVYRLYKWNKIRLDRAVRRAKMFLRYRIVPSLKAANPLRSYAMIFGKSHVMTFDGKYYDFVRYAKPECSYLLSRDFKDGNFTVLSNKDAIIIKTPDMKVEIHENGRVSSEITAKSGGTKVVKDLPIETESGYCKIWKKTIKCAFKQGVQIRCNIEHFYCSVELSGWHYGKSQGLLGTNNNEAFDEFKKPDNTITNSVTELANSWLVSKDPECIVADLGNEAPTCNKAPSDRCFELFKFNSSPFAKSFSKVDALPFLKACQIDSADCDSTEAVETSHCNATAAYRHMLRLNGVCAPKIADCEKADSETGKVHKRGDTWTQKATKSVDVVVIMSGRTAASKFRRTIASMLYNTNKNFKKMGFSTRYALISFGAATWSSYGSKHHTHDGKYFSTEEEITTSIKQMAYTGESTDTNDYYAAIHRASNLNFKHGAARVFILFNFDDYKPSWFGTTLDETMYALKYEANASLFVFDKFSFERFENRDVIGKTPTQVYLNPFTAVPMATELPTNVFTKLVRPEGGMFVNDLKASQRKTFTAALSHAAAVPVRNNLKSCKVCVKRYRNIICRSDNTVTC